MWGVRGRRLDLEPRNSDSNKSPDDFCEENPFVGICILRDLLILVFGYGVTGWMAFQGFIFNIVMSCDREEINNTRVVSGFLPDLYTVTQRI